MASSLPVVAAIPNYNMGEQLTELLPQLVRQDYTDIFVLDDASTDDSRQVVRDFDSSISFTTSRENLGAGATRNRITSLLRHRALIHFVDADMELQTEDVVRVASEVMPSETIGFVGGLARTPLGFQSVWNFGPRLCLRARLGARQQDRINNLIPENLEGAKSVRAKHGSLLYDWPDPFSEPQRRPVFWNIEQNLLLDSEVFVALGGFDQALREYEIQDLAIRMFKAGLKRFFDPLLSAKHKEVQVRQYDRQAEMNRAEIYIARKHGLLNWLMPDGRFKPAL